MVEALERAFALSGGPSALAKAIGNITPQAISQWKKVPAERVLDVARITGIPAEELRPDLAALFAPTSPDQSKERVA